MKKKNNVASAIIGLLSSILAFLGMIGVCGFPLLAAFLAWFGIGASQLTVLSEYQPVFMTTAIIALLYGFYSLYFKNKKGESSTHCGHEQKESEPSCNKVASQSKWLAKTMLWIAAMAVLSTYFMNSNSCNSSDNNEKCNSQSTTVPACKVVPSPTFSCSPNDSTKNQDKQIQHHEIIKSQTCPGQ